MKKFLAATFLLGIGLGAFAQDDDQPVDTSWMQQYRATSTRINDLIHTKLDVSFDYDKSWMYGKAWITLHPHFYPTDSVTLDAKGMEIKNISIVKGNAKSALKYRYDSSQLFITLDKSYKRNENYTLYIDYVSRPNDLKVNGSAAITDAKGLYFVSPKDGSGKETQIWTQGETEANSAWFPTIDKPNQKSTEEISMTVPAKFVTLSNGKLISQKKNADGTRTDYWKMDLPHAPYLFFMGVGDFVIVKDKYKNIPVDYYVEKEYAPYAKGIFGETPAMIGVFEEVTGIPYPWPKYDQMVGRDYVSGAMENTTATLHQESAYQNARELSDGNNWEETIAHELFHQWFGDLVTAESWSNITLNESFADYSETLWNEFRYGKDAGDEKIQKDREEYFSNPANAEKNLVRFHYNNKEDVFDQVSYPKGGAILHMLRNYVGDSAFFKSLNQYLTANKFKSAEVPQLRLAFEEVTGQDLNWFFNQWYFGDGHPELTINYDYSNGQTIVTTEQTGKIFKMPVAIDVYGNDGKKKRYQVWIENQKDTFYFASASKPALVNVDADKVLLIQKTDNKSAEEYAFQFKNAPNYLDRREALEYFAENNKSELVNGLTDKYWGLRLATLNLIDKNKRYTVPSVINAVAQVAEKGQNKNVIAKALDILIKSGDRKYQSLFEKYVSDSSYNVAGTALEGLMKADSTLGYQLALQYKSDARGKLKRIVTQAIMQNPSESDFDYILNDFDTSPMTQTKIAETVQFAGYLAKVKDPGNVRKGVDAIMKFRNFVPSQYHKYIDPVFKQSFARISAAKSASGQTELANYIDGLLP